MNKKELILNCAKGIVLYHYDFTNKEGIHVNTTKALFDIKGLPVFVYSKGLNNKKIGSELLLPIYFDGKDFCIDNNDIKD